MKFHILALLFIEIAMVSCTATAPPAAKSQPKTLSGDLAGTPSASISKPQTSSPKPDAAPKSNSMPIIPKGAQWTIYCKTISGPGHVQRAEQYKDDLVRGTPLKDWYIIHGETESNLYHGFYRSNDRKDRQEYKRIQTQKAMIEALEDQDLERPFKYSLIVELMAADPVAPPEWNFANLKKGPADDQHFWSLQIAAYQGSPQRKQYAVDAVREFRARGIEAYYYHGDTISSICIGAWPREAVKEQESDNASSAAVNDPTADIFVTNIPLSAEAIRNLNINHRGGNLVTMQSVIEPLDPTLIAAMRTYPEHHVNGTVRMRPGKDGSMPERSYLVPVPVAESDSLLGGNTAAAGQNESPLSGFSTDNNEAATNSNAAPSQRRPAKQEPARGTGRLKSIGG